VSKQHVYRNAKSHSREEGVANLLLMLVRGTDY
jgi:hypothetical protein